LTARDSAQGFRGAIGGNIALIAIHAQLMVDLKLKRPISKGIASCHTFPTSNAKLFDDFILEERIFYKISFNGTSGAQLVFGTCGQWFGTRPKIAST